MRTGVEELAVEGRAVNEAVALLSAALPDIFASRTDPNRIGGSARVAFEGRYVNAVLRKDPYQSGTRLHGAESRVTTPTILCRLPAGSARMAFEA